jgi:DNA-binding IclR family transcriptional regulator
MPRTPTPVACNKNPTGAQSICRAILLLRTVARHNDSGANLSALVRETGLHTSTVHRILSVLVAEGLITYDTVSKMYHLGLELYHLGGRAHQYVIRDHFRGAMDAIEEKTHDTVFLLIRSGNDVLCIDRVEGTNPVRTIPIDVGARRPLGIGAGSTALIAFIPDGEYEKILRANESRYAQYRDMTVQDVRALVDAGRQSGYVVSPGVFHDGVTSVGVPIFNDRNQVIAAITVSAIRDRMRRSRREWIAQIVKEATRSGAISLYPEKKET